MFTNTVHVTFLSQPCLSSYKQRQADLVTMKLSSANSVCLVFTGNSNNNYIIMFFLHTLYLHVFTNESPWPIYL